MKIFISQPMSGRTEKAILEEKMETVEALFDTFGRENTEILNSYFTNDYRADFEDTFKDSIVTFDLYWLSQALEVMAEADVMVMVGDWKKSKGCKIEKMCAKQYNVPIIYAE